MGYTTDFTGQFNLNNTLETKHSLYLTEFANTRRMRRDAAVANNLPDPIRQKANLPIGDEGGYFVGSKSYRGQSNDTSVLDLNKPPSGQPGLWCQWMPNDTNNAIIWDGGEKFYKYVDWLSYLIKHFLNPWGYKLYGRVAWQGEDPEDKGFIYVDDNQVDIVCGDSCDRPIPSPSNEPICNCELWAGCTCGRIEWEKNNKA
jgi:hypothetical protein